MPQSCSAQHEADRAEQLVRLGLSTVTLYTSLPRMVEPNADKAGQSARSRQHSRPVQRPVWRPSVQGCTQKAFACAATGQQNAGAAYERGGSDNAPANHHCPQRACMRLACMQMSEFSVCTRCIQHTSTQCSIAVLIGDLKMLFSSKINFVPSRQVRH